VLLASISHYGHAGRGSVNKKGMPRQDNTDKYEKKSKRETFWFVNGMDFA
jgi:hypothetical protein